MEIMDDIHDFWTWMRDGFEAYLHAEGDADVELRQVLVTGESAGGYLSVQSALGSAGGMVRAAIAMYPVLDIKSRFFTQEYEKIIMGQPMVPKDVLTDHLRAVEDDARNGKKRVVTGATPPERVPLAISIVQRGLYRKLLGEVRILYPFERIEDVQGEDMPPILIIHGREDSAVPVEGSEKWAEKANEEFGGDKVKLVVQPGEHGFDMEPSITLETPWLKNELVPITKAWLGEQ